MSEQTTDKSQYCVCWAAAGAAALQHGAGGERTAPGERRLHFGVVTARFLMQVRMREPGGRPRPVMMICDWNYFGCYLAEPEYD